MQQHRSVRDAGTSMASRAGGSPWTAALRLLAVLLLALGATGPAWAACAPVETASIPSGGSATFGCSLFGFEEPPVTAPTHGTLTFGTPSNIAAVTYTNNGDGALSDTFVLRDFDTDLNITFNITVGPASSIVIAPSSLPAPSVGVAYSQTLTTSGGVAPYSYSLGSGSLPPGLSFSGSGVVSGTSTGSGPYTFTVDVVDSASPLPASASKTYTFTIAAPILDLTPDTPPNGVISVPYSMQFATSGGTAPYTYTIEAGLGTLPPGLSMSSSGLVSGTPTATGSYTFSLRHDDSTTISTGGDHFRAQMVTITIDPPPTISVGPASLPAAAVGAAYSQTITASGGTSPYTFAVTAGALPAGLTLGSGGTLSGTPTAGGTFNFTVTATDNNGFTGSRAYSLTVGAPTISIAPTTLPGGTAGAAYSQSITAAGATAPYSFAITAGALPAGLALAANGALSGTPTAAGTFNFTVTATDSSTGTGPFTGSRAYAVVIASPTITVAPATLPNTTVGSAYSQTITASGGTAAYGFVVTAGALPAGMTLSTAGALSGTPTMGGTFNFTVTATDANGFTGSRAYSLVIAAPALSLAPASLPNGTLGAPYSQTITASGGTAPYFFAVTAGALPGGLTLNSGGALSGTPTAQGSFNFSVTATDSSGGTGPYTATVAFTLVIGEQAPVANAVAATVAYGSGANPITLNITGGTPTSVAVVASPSNGTAIASGVGITYQPNVGFAGADSFTYNATNSAGTSAPATVSITVTAPTITLSPATLPDGMAGDPYGATVTGSGGTAPYTFSIVSGALPIGMSFSSAGVFSGTPSVAGTFTFTLRAADANGFTGDQAYTIVIASPTIALAPATLPDGMAGDPYGATVTGSGGTAPYSFSILSGALPAGVSFSSAGTFSGTPSVAGSYTFTLRATDANGFSGDRAYTIVIASPTIALAPATLPDGMAGDPYGATVTGSGGTAPYSFSILSGALPAGVSFSSAGVFSGTPSVAGSYTFTLRATDANGFSGDHAYSVVIAAPTITMSPTTLPDGLVGMAYSQAFAGAGGAAPYDFSIVSGAMPVGMSFSSAGVFSGTPTVGGTYNFVLRATDDNGFSGDQAYTFVVATPTITLSPPTLPDGTAGIAYSQTLIAGGGTAPYSFSIVSGTLPAGMSFSSAGVFSGTPTAGGSFSFTLRATDDNGISGDRAYTFLVAAPTITLSPATLPNGTAGTTYDQTLTAAGGTAPYGFAVTAGTLPVGMVLSGGGNLSGTVSAAGSYSFDITATDGLGFSGVRSYTLVIGAAVPVAVDDSAATDAGVAVTIPVAANDIGAISTVAVASAPTSGSATVSGLDVVYTPNSGFFGADSFTYNATGPGGSSNIATVSIEVRALPVPVGVPQAVTTLAGQPVAIEAAAGASGGPFTGVTIVDPPASGAVMVSGTTITYTPLATDSGVFTVGYTLHNAFGASAPIDSTITVNPLPLVASREISTIVGVPVQVELTDGATGGPFTAANVVAVSPAAAGTATIAQSGSGADARYQLTFAPDPGFAGVAEIGFTLSNAFATSEPGTITVDVAPRSDPSQDPEVRGLLAAQASATRRFATAQISNFHQRLEGMHDGGGGEPGFQNGITFAINDRCRDGARRSVGSGCQRSIADEDAPVAAPDAPVGGEAGPAGHSLVLWTGGAISTGDQDDRGGGDGFDFETTGVTVGADYRLNPKLALGAGLGYGRDDTDIGDNGTRSDTEGYTVALYASYHPGKAFYLDGLLGYQWLTFESRRHVTATGSRVSGERDGTQWFASLAAGYDYRNERIGVTPYARLDVARAQLDSYTEQGDPIHALHYGDQDVDTTTGNLGMRFEYRQPVGWGTFVPQLRLEYQHDFEGDSLATINYADLTSGPFYRVRIDGADRSRFVFGLGAVLQAERDWMLRLEYRGVFGDSQGSEQSILLNFEKTY